MLITSLSCWFSFFFIMTSFRSQNRWYIKHKGDDWLQTWMCTYLGSYFKYCPTYIRIYALIWSTNNRKCVWNADGNRFFFSMSQMLSSKTKMYGFKCQQVEKRWKMETERATSFFLLLGCRHLRTCHLVYKNGYKSIRKHILHSASSHWDTEVKQCIPT